MALSDKLVIIVSAWLLGSATSAALSEEPVVDLGYMQLLGNSTSPSGMENSNVTFFGAIPYAQPPLGELRWRAPQRLNESQSAGSLIDARNWGPACIQKPAAVGVGSEDCLTLNIWKPTNATQDSKLPVAVYIHGGGFYANTPQGFPLYDWVSQNQDGLVGVSITYRLGLLGFLASQSVKDDGALNAGLLDQREGLEWIQRHIASFGGDPERVTIYGESAGGASILMHVVAYGGTQSPPFRAAVAQSIGFGATRTDTEIEDSFFNVTQVVGCPSSGAEAMACLRVAPVDSLVNAINTVTKTRFDPVLDGSDGFLPDLPSRLLASGRFADVDVIAGYTTHDGRSFAVGKPSDFVTEDDIRSKPFSRWPLVTNDTITKALALYPADEYPTVYDRAWTIAGELIYDCEGLFLAEAMANKTGNQDIYAYRWNAPDTVLYNANPYLGAMHTSDLYYLFEGTNTAPNATNYFTPFNETESALSQQAIAYWTSFAVNGNPSSGRLPSSPEWSPYVGGNSTRRRLILSRSDQVPQTEMEEISPAELERCRFWMSEEVTAETRI